MRLPNYAPISILLFVNTQYYIHKAADYARCIPNYIRVEECEKPITNNQFIV